MSMIIGVLIGFLYSLLAVSSMILVTRYALLKGWCHGISAASGVLASQLIYAILALLLLTAFHIHMFSSEPSTASQLYMVIPSMALIFFVAYKIYRAPMPEESKLETMSIFRPFMALFAISMARPMRLLGYMALLVTDIHGLESI